jgi:hypothetical protein
MMGFLPKTLLRRLYTTVAVLAFLPAALVILPLMIGSVAEMLMPIIVGALLIWAWRRVFGRRL